MIYDHNLTNDTLGPFAVGEWSKYCIAHESHMRFSNCGSGVVGMFVPVHYYGAVVPWFVSHRGNFSLLVHPNTGCGK
jgi:aromatic ring-cleaving dioxygenase